MKKPKSECPHCGKSFKNSHGLNIHQHHCKAFRLPPIVEESLPKSLAGFTREDLPPEDEPVPPMITGEMTADVLRSLLARKRQERDNITSQIESLKQILGEVEPSGEASS